MTDSDLREFARRYTEAWCSGDPARVAEHYAPEGSLTINGGVSPVGRAAITEGARSFMEGLSRPRGAHGRPSSTARRPSASRLAAWAG